MARAQPHPLLRYLLRGLGLLLPVAVTMYLLLWLWRHLIRDVVGGADAAVAWLLERLAGDEAEVVMPPQLRLAVAVVAVLVLLLFLGWWLSGFIGRRVYQAMAAVLERLPVIGAIYPHVRQITDFFFADEGERKVEFQRVAAVPYPRQGLYSLALVTGSQLAALDEATGRRLVSVFIPSSPMPATGYTIFVPAEDLIPLDMTVDEALKMIVSAGVLVPPGEVRKRVLPGTPAPLPPPAETEERP